MGVCVCLYECVCLCLDVFVQEAEEAEEAEGEGVMQTSTLGVYSMCVCALCVKWRPGENRGTRLYNGVRTQPASRSLHLSAAAQRHTYTHSLLAHRPNQTSCNLSFGCELGRQRWVTFSFRLHGNPSL